MARNAGEGGGRETGLVRRLDSLAYLLDNSIPIPGTGRRFGLDAVIGLIPGVGDAAGAVLSGYIVLEAARIGAPPSVIARMLLNLGIEAVVGALPFAGDLFDAWWKANDRNVRLLHQVVDRPGAARRSSRAFVAVVVLLLVLVLAGGIALAFWLAWMLVREVGLW